uniref:Uncharacterized protein n=1 Tax=Heterorhabditis bacteriophora TaxID=37862 RepID=A0A1I7XFL6_HETBA
MTALARWRRMKEEEEKGPVAKRPHDTSLCTVLTDAERFRREASLIGQLILRISSLILSVKSIALCGVFEGRDF